jgi:hypothetical protein
MPNPLRSRSVLLMLASLSGLSLSACTEAPDLRDDDHQADNLTVAPSAAAAPEDALADAFALFKKVFVTDLHFDENFPIGFGFHPGLSTRKIRDADGNTPRGSAVITFVANDVAASLSGVPADESFDLFLVKNLPGTGRTAKPETGDTFLKLGTFTTVDGNSVFSLIPGLDLHTRFDWDLIIVTEAGKLPSESVIAAGALTLFEKRLFRARGKATGVAATNLDLDAVETTDPLVARGAHLFFEETFGGNGRTCGTCHPPQHSLTIDPPFIATLPSTDPLFVAETNPALKDLEDTTLLRQRALIRENLDGFDAADGFVARGVPHTFALNTTNGISRAGDGPGNTPPDHRLGWGGDGAPGRSTLNEFPFGAIVQHFTKTLARRPGIDFQIPTQEDLDALEAFQLFTGRHTVVDLQRVKFRDSSAAAGATLFFNAGCTGCHVDMQGFDNSLDLSNATLNTGIADLPESRALPLDDGFRHTGAFNIPSLVEAADTPPFFHNNARATIEDAVQFYTTDAFNNSPDGGGGGFSFPFNATQVSQVADFLRVINAAENIRQVKKRVQFVHDHRSTTDNTSLITFALADTQDAINDLAAKSLNSNARTALASAKSTLQKAQAAQDDKRPALMTTALKSLATARSALFSANPDNQF